MWRCQHDAPLITFPPAQLSTYLSTCTLLPAIIQGVRLALGPLRHSKTRNGPLFLGPFFRSELAPLGTSWGSKFRCRSQIPSPFLGLGTHLGVKKRQSVSSRKIMEITQWVDQKCMSFDSIVIEECASSLWEKCTSQQCIFLFFELSSPLIFEHCVFYYLRHGRQKKNNEPRGPFSRFFGTLWPILRLRGPEIFGTGMCGRTAGFYHVLSVSVVPSVSVESAMERQMTCLVKCFLRCVFERYDAVCQVCANRRNRLWRPRKLFLACGPKHCRFSRTSHGCLPTSCDTRGSKLPAFLRDWQELDAERAVL